MIDMCERELSLVTLHRRRLCGDGATLAVLTHKFNERVIGDGLKFTFCSNLKQVRVIVCET